MRCPCIRGGAATGADPRVVSSSATTTPSSIGGPTWPRAGSGPPPGRDRAALERSFPAVSVFWRRWAALHRKRSGANHRRDRDPPALPALTPKTGATHALHRPIPPKSGFVSSAPSPMAHTSHRSSDGGQAVRGHAPMLATLIMSTNTTAIMQAMASAGGLAGHARSPAAMRRALPTEAPCNPGGGSIRAARGSPVTVAPG